MRRAPSRRRQGFTLLELMVTGTILVIGLMGIYLAFDSTWATYTRGRGKVDAQQNARVAMDQIARQSRMAGYFPENFTTPPPAIPLATPLHVASESALAIYGDADGSGASSVFLFCRDGSNLRRGKAASGLAAAYTCSPALDLLAENVTSLGFTYYDANNVPTPNPPAPPYALDGQGAGAVPDFTDTSQRGAVRRVVITLTARRDVPGQEPQSYTLTSDVRLRNLN